MRAGSADTVADREARLLNSRSSGIAALALVVEQLWQQGQGPLGERIEARYATRGRMRDNIWEHRTILETIVTAYPARARQAMRHPLLAAVRQQMRALGTAGDPA